MYSFADIIKKTATYAPIYLPLNFFIKLYPCHRI